MFVAVSAILVMVESFLEQALTRRHLDLLLLVVPKSILNRKRNIHSVPILRESVKSFEQRLMQPV